MFRGLCSIGCLAVILVAPPALAGDLPNPKFTPGQADQTLTKDVICAPGFNTKAFRAVPAARKRGVYREYGVSPDAPPCPCEVDHLIPLDLGGANALLNLWAQSHSTMPWNSIRKDRLERRLHKDVCAGKIELDTAQHEIATDWTAAYAKRFGRPALDDATK
jgi:hypothetical protein